MKYKVLVSFSGAVSASRNSIIEISDAEIANDLMDAGYIEEVNETKKGKKTDKDEE
jgi:hypothetical protein|nr:MAG TPA: hypothetical protein [Caudoviricetes sp.]